MAFRLTASLDDMLENIIGHEYGFDAEYQELVDMYPDLFNQTEAYDNATNNYFYGYY